MRHSNNGRRSRNNNGRHHHNHGGNHSHNNNNNNNNSQRRVNPRMQTFDSNGPDVRIRGNAFQVTEKYQGLARDASAAGDRVLAESYLQHAEHYQRMLNEYASFETEQRAQYQQRQPNAQDVRIEENAEESDDGLADVRFLSGGASHPGDGDQPAVPAEAMQPVSGAAPRGNPAGGRRPQPGTRGRGAPRAAAAKDEAASAESGEE